MKTKQYIIRVLGVIWALALLIFVMQIFIMSRQIIFIPLALLLAFIAYWLHHKLSNSKKKWARHVIFVYAGINFIPLLLQLFSLKVPGADNVVTAIIGWLLLRFND